MQRINVTIRAKAPSCIRISIGALKLIGSPSYIRILFNPNTKEIGFQASSREDTKSLKIVYNKFYVFICTKMFSNRIFDLCKWYVNGTYRIKDCYITPENILMFKLDSAKNYGRYLNCLDD